MEDFLWVMTFKCIPNEHKGINKARKEGERILGKETA